MRFGLYNVTLFVILITLPGFLFHNICNEVNNSRHNFSLVVMAHHKTGSMFIWSYFRNLRDHIGSNWFSENSLAQTPTDAVGAFASCEHHPKILAPHRPGSTGLFSVPCSRNTSDKHVKKKHVTLHDKKTLKVDSEDEKNLNLDFIDSTGSWIIYHTRNPISLLVSAYYSFGWTHIPPPAHDIEEWNAFHCQRKFIRSMSLDEFVMNQFINATQGLHKIYEELVILRKEHKLLVLTYETMMTHFTSWHQNIIQFLNIDNDTAVMKIERKFQEEVNRVNEGKGSTIVSEPGHVRSGIVDDYKVLLKPSTLQNVSHLLELYHKIVSV